ncbi:MAG: T9SS type A sorting domain-containing protein, partial [candidate division KSB1 bacterium]|nr:T9SS type A sorting domain-containing protein [candidate division KSB1 bacterium]
VPERRALYNAFAAFIRLKKRPEMLNPSVKSSFAPSFKWMSLTTDSLNVVLAANFDVIPLDKSMPFPKSGKWYDLNGDSLTIRNTDTLFTFSPGQYRLLLDYKIFRTNPSGIAGSKDTTRLQLLAESYPNPFNSETVIRFYLPADAEVRVTIFDARGRKVKTLHHGTLQAGRQLLVWDCRTENDTAAASGVYFCRIESAQLVKSLKLICIK